MPEKPTNRELLQSALTREISDKAEAYCRRIDSKHALNGRGPALAQQIRECVQKLLDKIDGDLGRLTDAMTPRELLQTICPRILNTVETELFDKIPSLPNEVKRAIQQQVKEIRLCIFRDCDIHPWTHEESQLTTFPIRKNVRKGILKKSAHLSQGPRQHLNSTNLI